MNKQPGEEPEEQISEETPEEQLEEIPTPPTPPMVPRSLPSKKIFFQESEGSVALKQVESLYRLLTTRVEEIANANERTHQTIQAGHQVLVAGHQEIRATVSLVQDLIGQFDDVIGRLEQATAALITLHQNPED